jgi:uncharacterized membrane protein HdeD (DUF308 family)
VVPPPTRQALPQLAEPVPPQVVAGAEPPADEPIAASGPGPERRPSADGAGAIELLIVGVVTLLLGVVIATMQDEYSRIWVVSAHLLVYAAHWLFVGFTQATGVRRALSTVLGVSGLAAVGLIGARPPVYLEYWDVVASPLYLFWVIAGVVQIGAAVAGGPRPARALEITAGVLATAFGLLVIYLVSRQAGPILAVSFGHFAIVLGIIWVVAGLRRRRAVAP